ncbi:P27 family phage terminase small subunit [Variovorax soli]|uniref:Phage terminase small subunit n=1 Tax=Variovorax soli TaxID=376815 RepID=A0ABU1NAY1_9BURK|nr:P27 family phage terminase small subunit [Variovorax soli]MDR6535599.1 phage terminase small subunit [Variovorax soli]
MAALTKGRLITGKPRIKSLNNLSEGPARVFAHVVNSVDPSHFSDVDLPLLESYAVAAYLTSEAAEHLAEEGTVIGGRASPWLAAKEKADKLLVALSARLRICPQSRFDRLVAGANSRSQPNSRRPWESDPDGLLAGDDDEIGNKFFNRGRKPR